MKRLIDTMPVYAPWEEGGELDTCWTPVEVRKERAFWYLHNNAKTRSSWSHKFTAFVQRVLLVAVVMFIGALLVGAAV